MDFFKYSNLFLNSKFIVFLVTIVIVLKYLSKKFSRDPRLVKFAESLPGPYPYPFVGNTLSVLLELKKGGFTPFFTSSLLKYGPVSRFWFGSGLGVLLSDPQEVETALTNSNCLSRSPGNETFRILFGNSLLVASPVSLWKRKRKEYQPFFTQNRVLEHIPATNEMIYKFFKTQKFAVEGREFDWQNSMNDLSLGIFTKTFFNYELTDAEKSKFGLTKLHLAFLQLATKWLCSTKITDFLCTWVWGIDIPKLREKIIALIDKIIRSNEKWIRAPGGNLSETENLNSRSFPPSFIETLIRVKKEIGEDDLIHGELAYFFMAASQTTSIALSSCLLALAAHPEIQEKLYQEIHQLFGDEERRADQSDLEKLPYLHQVLKETLRLFTIAPAMYRLIENDAQIGTRIYPKGSFILINITGIHHDPNLYPDPYRFNPDNFTEEAISKRHRFSFIPFGAGPRYCLAKSFVEQNLKLNVIALLRKFSFHTSAKLDDLKFKLSAFEYLSTGYPLSVRLRKSRK